LLEEAGELQLRRKWWRKSWETVQLMVTFRLQACLPCTKKVFLARKVSFILHRST
jgi:hypothetical protein